MLKLRKGIMMAVIGLMVMSVGSALAARYEIVAGDKSEIVFKSKAPLEKFDGKTKQLSGYFEADLANLQGSLDLEVEIDLASFDTGKKKRNKHMRENHLETDKFPKAWFRGRTIKQASSQALVQGGTVTVVVSGVLDLHGVKVNHDVTLKLSRQADGMVNVQGQFPVLLSEHEIDRPKFLVMKLADEQQVVINLLLRPVS